MNRRYQRKENSPDRRYQRKESSPGEKENWESKDAQKSGKEGSKWTDELSTSIKKLNRNAKAELDLAGWTSLVNLKRVISIRYCGADELFDVL